MFLLIGDVVRTAVPVSMLPGYHADNVSIIALLLLPAYLPRIVVFCIRIISSEFCGKQTGAATGTGLDLRVSRRRCGIFGAFTSNGVSIESPGTRHAGLIAAVLQRSCRDARAAASIASAVGLAGASGGGYPSVRPWGGHHVRAIGFCSVLPCVPSRWRRFFRRHFFRICYTSPARTLFINSVTLRAGPAPYASSAAS